MPIIILNNDDEHGFVQVLVPIVLIIVDDKDALSYKIGVLVVNQALVFNFNFRMGMVRGIVFVLQEISMDILVCIMLDIILCGVEDFLRAVI